jgi:hypothetical protein
VQKVSVYNIGYLLYIISLEWFSNDYRNGNHGIALRVIDIIYRRIEQKSYAGIFRNTECRQVPGCKKAGPAGPALDFNLFE